MKKMTKWTAAFLAAMMVWLGFLSCSNPSNDSGTDNENESLNPNEKTIVISDSLQSYEIGESISFTVSFSNFETKPLKVTVYEAAEGSLGEFWILSNRVTVPTLDFSAGSYSFYVKSDDVKSNTLSITLTAPEVTPYTFGSAGAALAEAMFTSLPGTSWADKDGSLHDKWTFSSLNDGKIPVVATIINDDGSPYDDTSFNYNLDVTRGVLIDSFGDDDSYVIYADGLLYQAYLFEKYEREGFSEGLVGKWVTEDDDFINIGADGKRTINNGVTSASIIKMSNGVMYYKLGNVQQNLYYDGTYIYELNEDVLYPVE